MEPSKNTPSTIDEYIAGFPDNLQVLLERVRATVREAAPGAEEKISYQIPTFTLNGKNLVHFGAFKGHIGFYPTPSGIEEFSEELAQYKGAKGSIQFPYDKPIPFALISRIVKFRVQEFRKNADKPKS